MEGDPARRKQILWQIERKLAEDHARPILFYLQNAICSRPLVKGMTPIAIVSTTPGASRTSCSITDLDGLGVPITGDVVTSED